MRQNRRENYGDGARRRNSKSPSISRTAAAMGARYREGLSPAPELMMRLPHYEVASQDCYTRRMDDAAAGAHAQDPAPDLRNLMHNAFRSLRRTWATQLEPWNLTPFQWRALRAIFSQGGSLRPGEIAERLRIAPRSATEVIDQLEGKGFVVRGRDPQDRRATQVRLTASGTETTKNILAERDEHSKQYFAPLSSAEQAQLAQLLSKLSEPPSSPVTSHPALR